MAEKAFHLGMTKGLPVLYKPSDLTTHAVIVGMTGSGKTGLAICLMEEALLSGIPVVAIDPKGDLPNLVTSGIENSEVSVYTPGSKAGLPVSLVDSLFYPGDAVVENEELFAVQVKIATGSILSLAQIPADPTDREFVFIAAIISSAWRSKTNLSLQSLISKIQNPPMSRIGVLDLASFFPKKERFKMTVQINSVLASPGFENWIIGNGINLGNMTRTESGKSKASIFSIGHLQDAERMFFVSVLLSKTIAWMRSLPGTDHLKAIIYMDEVFGFLPPVRNPPSKLPLMLLLKQARAFGVGIVLATQNPVDLDYKALSNAGTWMVGRLQTERDKDRLTDGLESVSQTAFSRKTIEKTISSLKKREFLLHNVHREDPIVFSTRNTRSKLSGPMTLDQIKKIDQKRTYKNKPEDSVPIVLDHRIQVFYSLSVKKSAKPKLMATANLFYRTKKFSAIDRVALYVDFPKEQSNDINWAEAETPPTIKVAALSTTPVNGVAYSALPESAGIADNYKKWKKDLLVFLKNHKAISVHKSKVLQISSGPGESLETFSKRVSKEIDSKVAADIDALKKEYTPQLAEIGEILTALEGQVDYFKQNPPGLLSTAVGLVTVLLPRKSRLIHPKLEWGRNLHPRTLFRAHEKTKTMHEKLVKKLNADIDKIKKKYNDEISTILVAPKSSDIIVRTFGLLWTD